MDLKDRNDHDLNNKQWKWGAWISGRAVGLVIKMQRDTLYLI